MGDKKPAPLTVAQLTALLAAYPADALVAIPAYESGWTSVVGVGAAPLVHDEDEPWYNGERRTPADEETGTVHVVLRGARAASGDG